MLGATLPTLPSAERGRCQHLVMGVVRHHGRIEAALGRFISHPPRFSTRAILFIAGFELIDAADKAVEEGMTAKIVHHAVEQAKGLASPAEAKLVNAVVRKLAAEFASQPVPGRLATADVLAEYFSHPEWLVKRWLVQFGAESTRKLLEWNQQPAPVYARWRPAPVTMGAAEQTVADEPPGWLKPTMWPGFYEVTPGHWSHVEPLLKAGRIYLQDPATRFAIEQLAPQNGETLLDACAAPGGKSLQIADAMSTGGEKSSGRIVALDLPGARIDRLMENLSRVHGVEVALVQGDVLRGLGGVLSEHKLPVEYNGVLLDVPCSNTGVMRHRVDVKWRLQENDLRKHARQQLEMLLATTRRVKVGGRLIYSTCSIDAEENEKVIESFIKETKGTFTLESSIVSQPWVSGHDGAAVFKLKRVV